MPAPLGVYVHWPYCARICPYCDFNVVRDRRRAEEQAALGDAILADLEAQAALTGPRRLVSVFLGGGTPSLMDPALAGRIVETAARLWPADGLVEVTLEANPTDAEASRFAAFAEAGVNRLSLGLQAVDDASLRFLGRNHSAAEGLRAAQVGASIFPRLSLDLIYALPGQTPEAWAAELTQAVGLGPEHLSPYQLTIEAGTAFDRAVRRGAFRPADPDLGAVLYETTQDVLSGLGFEAYEVSNHARGEAACSRHNLVYWRGEDYVGAGPGAHGRLTLDGGRTATVAEPRIADYIAAVRAAGVGWRERETLSPVEAAEERLLMGLRTVEGVALSELAPLGLDASHRDVAEMAARGFLAVRSDRLVATAAGRLVLDRLTSDLATANPPHPTAGTSPAEVARV
jgi:putative oxygen-independent coproporphyrinogen III oxidase